MNLTKAFKFLDPMARLDRWTVSREYERRVHHRMTEQQKRLRPTITGDGFLLPITGDYVKARLITSIRVETAPPSVVVSTNNDRLVIPCGSAEEADEIRHNIASEDYYDSEIGWSKAKLLAGQYL